MKLNDKEYRTEWVKQHIEVGLPFQIAAMAAQRGWDDDQLIKKCGFNPNNLAFADLNVHTLLAIAKAFDCGLLVKFVPFSRMVKEFEDVSPQALEAAGWDEENI